MKVSVEKPGSPEEVLAHFGKKGMRWGVRSKSTQVFRGKNPSSQKRSDSIYRSRGRLQKKAIDYHTERNKTRKAAIKKAYLKNPDRATSLRLTRGEKAVLTIMGLAVPPVGVGIAVGVGARVATRRHIEKKQARGGYN